MSPVLPVFTGWMGVTSMAPIRPFRGQTTGASGKLLRGSGEASAAHFGTLKTPLGNGQYAHHLGPVNR